MVTNINLTTELASAIQVLAAQQGRSVQEVATDLLAASLANGFSSVPQQSASEPVPKTLPILKGRPDPTATPLNISGQEMSDLVKNLDLQLELERYEAAFGHQHLDRADG